MSRAAKSRNLIIALVVVLGILASSGARFFSLKANDAQAAVQQRPLAQASNFTWSPTSGSVTIIQGTTSNVTGFRLFNDTGLDATFTISIPNLPAGWGLAIAPSNIVLIPNASSQSFTFQITVPANATPGTYNLTLTATSNGFQSVAFLTVTVTPPATNTPQPTATTGPTATPAPVCANGVEADDPGNDSGHATLILVNAPQQHGICVIGDVDWFKFGAVGGKVYTIDVPEMADGLDLSLDLYDDQGNRLASNDDFFDRTPRNAKDLKPRIQSWRAPRDGIYYIQVRDTLNLGGGDRTYTIALLGESYGPTPITVPEICRDLYEEDGLPEEATLITSNEVEPAHRLCPAGDADWVRFFGKANKTYYLYTDTRPYANNPDINNQTEAGADTVLYLADRDGISIIDFNDDIASSDAASLDSEIRFSPTVDGFYYAQIKNVGDIGNQFIRYDLVLKECVPGQECGRSPVAPTAPTSTSPGNGTPTPTEAGFPTETPEPTDTPEPTNPALFAENSLKPGPMVNGPIKGFADSAFERVWQRDDQPISAQRTARSWAWGPHGLMARTEGYLQSASGLRQVQYFDKARMEVNNPTGDRGSRWFVTTGLLVVELISGKAQIGDNQFVQHAPADIPIAGDPDDAGAPTYASFAGVAGRPAADRTGQPVNEQINRAGAVGHYAGSQRPETSLAHFVPETGHNIPQAFWDYLNSRGTIYEGGSYRDGPLLDWVFTLGYPISEPYWTRIRVGGVPRDVLVQPFQRRVLTYSPDNPGGWQVEMGNVGRHYYMWRYGAALPQ